MRLDLTPTEEARVRAAARKSGLAPAEYVKSLALENLPEIATTAEDVVEARLSQWYENRAISGLR